MKFLIVGRSGTGKDELKTYLMNRYNWKFVKSYATRAKRSPDEDTHIFISHEEEKAIPAQDKVAVTFIKNGTNIPDEYFCTRQQIEEADGYIIDPNGIKELLKNMPDETFEVIYMQAETTDKREQASIARDIDKEAAKLRFQSRHNSEDIQFTEFENSFKDGTFGGPNCQQLTVFENDYTPEWMEQTAFKIHTMKNIFQKLSPLIDDLAQMQILRTLDNGKIITYSNVKDSSGTSQLTENHVTKEQFAQSLYTDSEGLSTCILEWLALPHTSLHNETRVLPQGELSLRTYVEDYLSYDMSDKLTMKATAQRITDTLVKDEDFWNMIDAQIQAISNTVPTK